jgi:hypothetical protein
MTVHFSVLVLPWLRDPLQSFSTYQSLSSFD